MDDNLKIIFFYPISNIITISNIARKTDKNLLFFPIFNKVLPKLPEQPVIPIKDFMIF